MDAITPPKPKVLVEGEPFIPYMKEENFDPRLKPVRRAVQEAHGISAERAEALRLPAGDRRDAVEAQQQRHARSDVDARSVAQAQARGGGVRHQWLRLLHGAQLLDAEEAARKRASKAGG